MKTLRIISGRLVITSLLILLQLSWFTVFIIRLSRYSVLISTAFSLLSLLIVLFIIGKDENASYRIAWIVLIMALPLFGGLFYLFFGNKRLSKRMRIRLKKVHDKIAPLLEMDSVIADKIAGFNERALGTIKYLYDRNHYPVYSNTVTTYYPAGEDMYQDMLKELDKAKHFIFLEYFIVKEGLMWDSLLDILARKAAAGVDVRIIYDDVGSLLYLPGDFIRQMAAKGIKCMAFNKFRPILSLVMNNRDHRKIMVIDGHTAFNGGINIADEYINLKDKYGHWKDTGLKLQGDAVWGFTTMFLEMWNAFNTPEDVFEQFRPPRSLTACFGTDGYVQPFADSPVDDEPTGENVYIELLAQARHYAYIFTPYLIIDNEVKSALRLAAKRGVDVRIVTPGIPDKTLAYRLTRSNYAPLLEAGIRIYEYTPGFLHAKSCVCDDELAFIGTINIDYRSLYLHFECGTLLYKTNTVMDLKQDFLDTLDNCREVQPGEFSNKLFGRLFNAVLRLFAPLF